MGNEAYNPLANINLADSVAKALLARPCTALPPSDSFPGAGIYVIYYGGSFAPYLPISRANRQGRCEVPMYVGKATPAGRRKGGLGLGQQTTYALLNRLREHADSIEQAENIDTTDFRCRYLVVDEIWIPLGEQLLIERFSPLWNRLLDGFGNHDPGSGRYNQQRSPWDTVHPGRPWAAKCQPSAKPAEAWVAEIAAFFAGERRTRESGQ